MYEKIDLDGACDMGRSCAMRCGTASGETTTSSSSSSVLVSVLTTIRCVAPLNCLSDVEWSSLAKALTSGQLSALQICCCLVATPR